jgi:hypothetical protein
VYDPTSVIYNGKTYSLLSHGAADSTTQACQSVFLSLDSGYVIAPDDADSKAVITAHPWNTAVVIVASGIGYNSANYGTPGGLFGAGLLSTSGSTYKAGSCSMQILQVIYTRVLSFYRLLLSMHYCIIYNLCIQCQPCQSMYNVQPILVFRCMIHPRWFIMGMYIHC